MPACSRSMPYRAMTAARHAISISIRSCCRSASRHPMIRSSAPAPRLFAVVHPPRIGEQTASRNNRRCCETAERNKNRPAGKHHHRSAIMPGRANRFPPGTASVHGRLDSAALADGGDDPLDARHRLHDGRLARSLRNAAVDPSPARHCRLLVAAIRYINRKLNPPPPFPITVPPMERFIASSSEKLMYSLMFALPLVGWACSPLLITRS